MPGTVVPALSGTHPLGAQEKTSLYGRQGAASLASQASCLPARPGVTGRGWHGKQTGRPRPGPPAAGARSYMPHGSPVLLARTAPW